MGAAGESSGRGRERAQRILGGAAGTVLLAGAVVAACSSPSGHLTTARHHPSGPTTTTTPHAGGTGSKRGTVVGAKVPIKPTARAVSLVSYGDCSALLTQLKQEAMAEVGPYGLQAGVGPVAESMPMRGAAPQPVAAPSGAASSGAASEQAGNGAASSGTASSGAAGQSTAAGAPGAGPAYSTTNNQEAGVDEPDLAKTDGHLMIVLRHAPIGLQVVDVSTRSPHLDGFVGLSQIGSPTGLFLDGSEAVVIGGGGPVPMYSGPPGGAAEPAYPQPASGTTAAVISLTDPQHPTVVRSFSLGGQEVDARLVGGRVLVVLQGSPQLAFTAPRDGTSAEQQRALQYNRGVVSSSTLGQWLPSTTTQGSSGRQLPACPTVLHPTVASGLGTVSVVSLDPNSDATGPAMTVVGNASVVYASTNAMYLATASWNDQQAEGQGGSSGVTTDIHGFSLSDPANPRYLGSGAVPGVLTDQYALSEDNGVLRVATTIGQAYAPEPQPAQGQDQVAGPIPDASDNLVTVLQPAGGALVPIGQIDGLGRGERIYGVRFLGRLGYVVTYRQTDPLYVIDLSDPRHPALRGQLQLTGFSAYLHPLGGGRLLGLGQETDQGGDGVQVSVFDVNDPGHPVLDAKKYFESSYSTAEHDPHQFLWWPGRGLAIIPVQQYANGGNFTGDVVLRVNPDGSLTEVGRIGQPQPEPQPQPGAAQSGAAQSGAAQPAPGGGTMMAPYYGAGIERALIVGDLIYTVSDGGVLASDIDSLAQVAWLPFPSQQ